MDNKHLEKKYERLADRMDLHTAMAAEEKAIKRFRDAEAEEQEGGGIDRRTFLAAAGATAAVAGTALGAGTARAGLADRVAGITQDDPMQTIGLGVSVQERFFNRFKEDTDLDVSGTVAGLSEMITKFITGGNKTYSMIETNAYRQPALREAEVIVPIPAEKITNWEFADSLYTESGHIGADDVTGWPSNIVYWDENKDSFYGVPQFYNMDALGVLPHKFAPTQPDFAIPRLARAALHRQVARRGCDRQDLDPERRADGAAARLQLPLEERDHGPAQGRQLRHGARRD